MHSWGQGSFENEPANDWLEELVESEDMDSILMALQGVSELVGTEELEVVDCAAAIAAAEVVALANDKPCRECPGIAKQFVDKHSLGAGEGILKLAQTTVETIQEKSPLRTYWKGVGSLVEWLEAMEDLHERLQVA